MAMDSRAVLKDYESALEDLTFNSKPIINMLTMMAEKHKEFAPELVELVKTRFFKVRQEHKIPTLYLMDSMIKNLGGEFLQELTKGIVGVFCHAFEAMNDSKIRVSLYKLRQTWPPYIPVRKLAAIDRHIHAIDPNWPITAQEPTSPTIFLNPKFLETKEENNENKQNKERKPSPAKTTMTKKRSQSPALSSSNSLAPPTTAIANKREKSPKNRTAMGQGPSKTPPPLSESRKSPLRTKNVPPIAKTAKSSPPIPKIKKIQPQSPKNSTNAPKRGGGATSPSVRHQRQKVLEEQRQIKKDKQLSMGILPPPQDDASLNRAMAKHKRRASPSPEKKSFDPRPKRPRSASPTVATPTKLKEGSDLGRNLVVSTVDDGNGSNYGKHKIQEESIDQSISKAPRVEGKERDKEEELEVKPITESWLDLSDLPPELFKKHQNFMLEQAEKRLKSGTLTSEQHDQLVKQVEQLYELQRQSNREREQHHQELEERQRQESLRRQDFSNTQAPTTISQSHDLPPPSSDSLTQSYDSVSTAHTHPPPFDSMSYSHPHSPPRNVDSVTMHSHLPPPHDSVPHHRTLLPCPPQSQFPRHGYDDNFPPPRGPRQPPPRAGFRSRGPRGGRPFRNRNRLSYRNRGPPFRGSHSPRRHPPPPSGPLREVEQLPNNSDTLSITDLYHKLKSSGLLPQPRLAPSRPPLPMIRLNMKDLKQEFKDLYMILHQGEPCSSCGLRFRADQRDEYQAHLDWHYQENRMDKEGTRVTMRNWYLHPDDWITYDSTQPINLNEPLLTLETADSKEDSAGRDDDKSGGGVSCQVLSGEDTEVCNLCHEQLEQFWEEDEEEWHFRDALRTPDGVLYHSYCYVDSKDSQQQDQGGTISLNSSQPINEGVATTQLVNFS